MSEHVERRRVRERLYRIDTKNLISVGDRLLQVFDDKLMAQICAVERSGRPPRGRRSETENSQLPVILQTHLAYFVRLAKLASRNDPSGETDAGELMRRWGAWSGLPHKTTLSRGYRFPKGMIDQSILANVQEAAAATIPIYAQGLSIAPVARGPNGERIVGAPTAISPQWVSFTGRVPPTINANI